MLTSTSNPKVKSLAQLMKKAKVRSAEDLFVAEGMKMYLEAPKERIRQVYVSESMYQAQKERFRGAPKLEILSDHVFASVSGTKTPQGVLCVLQQYHYKIGDLLKAEHPHLLLLENVQDPGNAGTILRTAEGAGADGVILSRDCVDLYNPKTIRSTMGSIYRMPFLYMDSLKEILPALKKKGVRTYAAHLQGRDCYDKEDYRTGCAFFIGNEGNGLSRELSSKADVRIRIPMQGKLESLNAAVAASILMYEVCRQRR